MYDQSFTKEQIFSVLKNKNKNGELYVYHTAIYIARAQESIKYAPKRIIIKNKL